MKVKDLKRLAARYTVAQATGCWEWTGHVSKTGYGQLTVNGKSVKAHRFSYLVFHGELVDGLEIDHLCRNRKCVNPAHLEQVTKDENNRRGNSPTGINSRKTHCKHGHPLNEENTYVRYVRAKAERQCRPCQRDRYNEMYRRRRKDVLARQRERYHRLAALEE